MLTVSKEKSGQKISCSRCKHELLVPGPNLEPTDISHDDLIDIDDDIMHGGVKLSDATPVDKKSAADAQPTDLDAGQDSRIYIADEEEKTASGIDETTVEFVSQHDDDDTADVVVINDDTLGEVPASHEPSYKIHDSEDLDDELLPLTPAPDPIPRDTSKKADEHKDPFEVDESAALRIEGITPPERSFSTPCPLCASLVYATTSQVGQKLRCHDCHTMVPIQAPKSDRPIVGCGQLSTVCCPQSVLVPARAITSERLGIIRHRHQQPGLG